MTKLNCKRIVSVTLITLLIFSTWTFTQVNATAQTDEYIVIVDDQQEAEKIFDKYEVTNQEALTLQDENEKQPLALAVEMNSEQANQLEQSKAVKCIEEDSQIEKEFVEELQIRDIAKPKYDNWNAKAINTENVTDHSQDKIKVAVIDSGIDCTENINVTERKNFIPGEFLDGLKTHAAIEPV